MMNVLLFSLNAVLPIILLVAIGALLRRLQLLDDDLIGKVNRMLFFLPFPVALFAQIIRVDLRATTDWRLFAYSAGAVLVVFFAALLIVPRLVCGSARRGAIIQGIFRGNFLLLGYPLARNLFGEAGIGPTAVLLPIVIILYNVLAVFLLESFRGDDRRTSVTKVIWGCLRNPLIIGAVLGTAWSLLGIPLPTVLQRLVTDIAAIANPLALILLGGQFSWRGAAGNGRYLAGVVVARMVVIPVFVIGIAILLGFRGPELGALFVQFGAPTAVASYVMARAMNSDAELAGQIIFVTTVISAFTLFLGTLILRTYGWI